MIICADSRVGEISLGRLDTALRIRYDELDQPIGSFGLVSERPRKKLSGLYVHCTASLVRGSQGTVKNTDRASEAIARSGPTVCLLEGLVTTGAPSTINVGPDDPGRAGPSAADHQPRCTSSLDQLVIP